MKGQIKFSNVILMVLLVTGIFVGAGLVISDFERNYVETNITQPIGDYDEDELGSMSPSITELEEATTPIQEAFDTLADSEGGGFLKITGVVITDTIPKIFVAGIQSIPVFFSIIRDMIYSAGETIIPGESGDTVNGAIIISLILMGLVVWLLFKAIESTRRYPV